MAGQNFDRAVGGLNLVFSIRNFEGALLACVQGAGAICGEKVENISYTPFEDEPVICICICICIAAIK